MKYFSLDSIDSVILKWTDDRTAEFNSKQGREEEVREIVLEFEMLRDTEAPIYTEKRLKFFFPDIREVSKDEYTGLLAAIDQYNAEAKKVEAEADSKSSDQLRSFVMSFPTRNPNLLSYTDLSTLVDAFNDVVEDDILDRIDNDEEVDEGAANREALKTVYIILKHAENTSDVGLITNILRLVRGG